LSRPHEIEASMMDGRGKWSTAQGLALGVWRDFRRCLPQLLGYELLFKIVAVAALAPFSAWLLRALISTAGGVSLSNEQILTFLVSPLGVLTILVMGTVGIAILFAEQAGLLSIATNALAGGSFTTAGALRHTAGRMPDLLKLAFVQVAVYLLCLVPFVGIVGVAYALLLSGHDINYYLAERPPAFQLAVAIAAAGAVLLLAAWAVLYVRWVFALPASVLSGEKPLAALASSFRLSRGALFRVAVALGAWFLAMSLLGGITAAVLWLAERLLLGLAGEALGPVILAVAALVSLNVLAAIALSFVGITTHCLLVARLYCDARRETGEPLSMGPRAVRRPGRLRLPGGALNRRAALFSGASAFLLLSVVAAFSLVETLDLEDRVAVTAHRGNTGKAPENTLSAIEASIQSGAEFAEIDVQETADGVVVVFHDADLMRTAGVDRKIWEIRYEELKQLDVGAWFAPQFRGERVPTLEEAIETAQGRINLNIELKYNGHDEKLAERVVRIVRDAGFEPQCVISSLEYGGLVETKRRDPKLEVGFVVFRSIGDLSRLDVNFLSVNSNLVTEDLIHRARRNGKAVHAWTVNDRPTMSRMIHLGVDNVITDDPETLLSVLQERTALGDVERLLLAFRAWRLR
jgi:glycerophosphoryl diester phosphodiesterase